MIIVNFSQIADVPPQSVNREILDVILQDSQNLIDSIDYTNLTHTLCEWEYDLFIESAQPDQDWYTKALLCICMRGLRGESRPNILNISEE